MTILKPAAESKFSVCCVWAHPTTRAIKANAEARLNPLKICFTAFLFSWLIAWSQFDGPLFDIAGANQRVKEFSTIERLLFLGESSKGQVKCRLLLRARSPSAGILRRVACGAVSVSATAKGAVHRCNSGSPFRVTSASPGDL